LPHLPISPNKSTRNGGNSFTSAVPTTFFFALHRRLPPRSADCAVHASLSVPVPAKEEQLAAGDFTGPINNCR
jgi:hypothetical protein